MMGATVEIAGAKRASRYFRNLTERLDDPRSVLKIIGEFVRGLSLQAFRDSADPKTHTPWMPLAESTIQARRNKGREGTKILIDRGTLRDSIHARLRSKSSVIIGTNLVYGATHQFGRGFTSSRSGGTNVTIPARPFLGVDKSGEDTISQMVKRFLEGAK